MQVNGGLHEDNRGSVAFVNDFDVSHYQRCYHITHSSVKTVRAWQGHFAEEKAFWVTKGAFLLQWIFLEGCQNPAESLEVFSQVISASEPKVLMLPAGYANGFQALEVNSSLMVFSNKSVKESEQDDYRWPADYFTKAKWRGK